jgi:hypothetical protein
MRTLRREANPIPEQLPQPLIGGVDAAVVQQKWLF